VEPGLAAGEGRGCDRKGVACEGKAETPVSRQTRGGGVGLCRQGPGSAITRGTIDRVAEGSTITGVALIQLGRGREPGGTICCEEGSAITGEGLFAEAGSAVTKGLLGRGAP
jgi:hypothetical protein